MREHFPWTINLGRWGEVRVRLHIFFLLMAVSILYVSWLAGQSVAGGGMWLAALGVVVLLGSVALHAAGHVFAANRLSVPVEPLVIGPLGDFVDEIQSRNPRGQLIVALAGPAANVFAVLACAPVLMIFSDASFVSLLHPLLPTNLTSGPAWLVAVKIGLWMNWTLALVNLLPARPLDGARIVGASLLLLAPGLGPRRAARVQSRLGVISGLALLLGAWLMYSSGDAILVPPWVALLLLAILILFSSQRQPERPPIRSPEDEVFGYDFSEGYTSLERSHAHVEEGDSAEDDSGPLERWLDSRRETRRQRQRQLEAQEDERVDEILARVHEQGMESLTAEERVLLERASQRYRMRGS